MEIRSIGDLDILNTDVLNIALNSLRDTDVQTGVYIYLRVAPNETTAYILDESAAPTVAEWTTAIKEKL